MRIRYQEAVDVKEFEPKIKRLLDDHVGAMPAAVIELVDIHDTGMLKSVMEEQGISEASKADRIASATRRAIRHHVLYGGHRIDFTVVRRHRKTLEIGVEPDTSVTVTAPLDAPVEEIAEKVRRRAGCYPTGAFRRWRGSRRCIRPT